MESRLRRPAPGSNCSRCLLSGPSILFGDGVPDKARLSGRCEMGVPAGDRNRLSGGRGRAITAGPCGVRGASRGGGGGGMGIALGSVPGASTRGRTLSGLTVSHLAGVCGSFACAMDSSRVFLGELRVDIGFPPFPIRIKPSSTAPWVSAVSGSVAAFVPGTGLVLGFAGGGDMYLYLYLYLRKHQQDVSQLQVQSSG